jgi:hypothetical protein
VCALSFTPGPKHHRVRWSSIGTHFLEFGDSESEYIMIIRGVCVAAVFVLVGSVFLAAYGFPSGESWSGLANASSRFAPHTAAAPAIRGPRFACNTSSRRGASASPVFAFFLLLGRNPVPVDLIGLRSGGEVARAVVAELLLPAKLGRAITSADVRLFVISREAARSLATDKLRTVSAVEKGAPLRALDAFDASELCDGSCLLVELKVCTSCVSCATCPPTKSVSTYPISKSFRNSTLEEGKLHLGEMLLDTEPHQFLLVLLTDSPEHFYNVQREVWRKLAISHPSVHVLFLHDEPSAPQGASPRRVGNDVFVPGGGGITPGILIKIIAALKLTFFELKLYRFVLKTNLSSFWAWERLMHWIKKGGVTIPTYAGVAFTIDNGIRAASGAGMLMSTDVAEQLVRHESLLDYSKLDDNAISILMAKLNYTVQDMPRTDFVNSCDSLPFQVDNGGFHFRVKCHDRVRDDAAIFMRLYEAIYTQKSVSVVSSL